MKCCTLLVRPLYIRCSSEVTLGVFCSSDCRAVCVTLVSGDSALLSLTLGVRVKVFVESSAGLCICLEGSAISIQYDRFRLL